MHVKKILTGVVLAATLAAVPGTATASTLESDASVTQVTIVDDLPESRINYTGNTFLHPGLWLTVTTSNNLFPDSPMVTNHSVNPGAISVRIVSALTHDVICSEMLLGRGDSGRTCRIPALSGEYAVQAMAMTTSANYLISVD